VVFFYFSRRQIYSNDTHCVKGKNAGYSGAGALRPETAAGGLRGGVPFPSLRVLRVSAFSLPPRHVNRPRFGTALRSPAPVAGCQVDRRRLTVAGQLAEGVFERRDAKNAARRSRSRSVNRGIRGIRGRKSGQVPDSAYSAYSAVPSFCETSSQPASKLGYCSAERALAAAIISAPTKQLPFGRQQASLFVPFASLAWGFRSRSQGKT